MKKQTVTVNARDLRALLRIAIHVASKPFWRSATAKQLDTLYCSAARIAESLNWWQDAPDQNQPTTDAEPTKGGE